MYQNKKCSKTKNEAKQKIVAKQKNEAKQKMYNK